MGTQESGQGRAVTLPNKQRRIDYIRDEYYNKSVSRSDIKTAINEMLEKANRAGEQIPYQIVFAATKTDADPRIASAAAKTAKAEAKAKADKAAAKAAAK